MFILPVRLLLHMFFSSFFSVVSRAYGIGPSLEQGNILVACLWNGRYKYSGNDARSMQEKVL